MSPEPSSLRHSPSDLEARLRRIDPAVRLVPERHARRVVRAAAPPGEAWAFHPHLPVRVAAQQLTELGVVRQTVLDGGEPDRVLLVEPSDIIRDSDLTDPELLRVYWRLLFRSRILSAITAGLTDDQCEVRMDALGVLATREIRYVLESDHRVPFAAPPRDLYRAFAAEVADRCTFAPQTIPAFFPTLPDANRVLDLIGRDLDVPALLAASRPDGAADPDPDTHEADAADVVPETPLVIPFEEESEPNSLLNRANRAADLGNHVRAAILRTRAANRLTGDGKDRSTAAAASAIRDGLVRRLTPILGWDYDRAKRWSNALITLLGPASHGIWPRAARVLYDLQRIGVDLEHEIDSVEPIEWLRSLGTRPLRRPLKRARPVIGLNHLRSAAAQLRRVAQDPTDRRRLERLLEIEIVRATALVRQELGPVLRQAFDDVGLRPANLLEEVARDKLVEELLDRVCDRGFLRLGDLRDAIARNQLKIPDLGGVREFVSGDPLLRADERLGEELHGVYRRGEIYLRWIQRITAVSFGTPAGRWLTRYVAIPFGGAFVAVEFAKYLAYEGEQLWNFVTGLAPARTPLEIGRPLVEGDPGAALGGPVVADSQSTKSMADGEAAEHAIELTPGSLAAMLIIAFVILGLLHSPAFRAAVASGCGMIWAGVKLVFREVPLAVWRSAPVQLVVRSVVTRVVFHYLGPGLFAGTATGLALWLIGTDPRIAVSWGWSAFLVMVLVFNSPLGRAIKDAVDEAAADAWRHVWTNLVPGLIGGITSAFRRLAGLVERVLYAVDERLRFRPGAAGESLVGKAVLAALWFPIAYFVRFAFTLLIEPQINPVKHFPVVTISHKLLLPLIPSLADATGLAKGTVTLIIGGVPGIFGFVVWELKENWRLYAANRPDRLPAVPIGHHGESMRGLLQAGFHSGTVPKLYHRLRSAVGAGGPLGRHTATSHWAHELDEIGHAVRALLDRYTIPLLRSSATWHGRTPTAGSVRVGVQQMTVRLQADGHDQSDLVLTFELVDGKVIARVTDEGWAGSSGDEEISPVAFALTGLIEKAGAKWSSDADTPLSRGIARVARTGWAERAAFWESARRRGVPDVDQSSAGK